MGSQMSPRRSLTSPGTCRRQVITGKKLARMPIFIFNNLRAGCLGAPPFRHFPCPSPVPQRPTDRLPQGRRPAVRLPPKAHPTLPCASITSHHWDLNLPHVHCRDAPNSELPSIGSPNHLSNGAQYSSPAKTRPPPCASALRGHQGCRHYAYPPDRGLAPGPARAATGRERASFPRQRIP